MITVNVHNFWEAFSNFMRRLHIIGIIIFKARAAQLFLYHGAWADQSLLPVLQIICYPVNKWL